MGQEEIAIYYLPTYAYRSIAGIGTAISDVMQNIMRGKKTTLYRDKEEAEKVAQNMRCDDDTSTVIMLRIRSYCCDNDYIDFVEETPYFKDVIGLHLWGFLKDWCEIRQKGKRK